MCVITDVSEPSTNLEEIPVTQSFKNFTSNRLQHLQMGSEHLNKLFILTGHVCAIKSDVDGVNLLKQIWKVRVSIFFSSNFIFLGNIQFCY